jgi:hypothetical protein
MNQVIIYKQDNGVVAVIVPTQKAIDQYGIQAIAIKDVPAGKPFKIVDAADIPEDRTFRNAWTADLSNPDGYGIGHDAWSAEQAGGQA